MSSYEIFSISLIFISIFVLIYKLIMVYDKKIKATDKALLELYDRIADLENQIKDNQ